MTTIPLYLKVKNLAPGDSKDPLFEKVSDKSIKFNDKHYDFSKIFLNDNDYSDLIDVPEGKSSSCFIFMGPTAAGKTTTLRKVINHKLRSLQKSKTVTFLTAFEVRENKCIVDLLEKNGHIRKEFFNTVTIESQLRKEKLVADTSSEILNTVFSKRNTQKTTFNSESSRSCLIITFYYNNIRATYIDMMGNEKFDKSISSSNIFANLNMSSITQLLTRRAIGGRSSNLITNLIFKKDSIHDRNISIILNLDQYGDAALVKSTLSNIADLIKNFKLEDTASPSKLDLSNDQQVPHYARPTVSSLSPKRITLSPVRKIGASPSKFRLLPNLNRPSTAPKFPSNSRANINQTPTRRTKQNTSPTNELSGPILLKSPLRKESNELAYDFYNIQITCLKRTIEDLEYENSQLKEEHKEILEQLNKENHDINADLTMLKNDIELENLTLKAELKNLQKVNFEHETLISQKKILNDKLDDFKNDFYKFKQDHGSFKSTVEKLKSTIQEIECENSKLKEFISNQSSELANLRNKIELEQFNNCSLKSELEKNQKEDTLLKEKISNLETDNLNINQELIQKNDQLIEMDNEFGEKIEKLTKSNDEREALINRLTEEKSALSEYSTEKEKLVAKLTNENSDKHESITELTDKISEFSSKLDDLERSEINYKEQVKELSNKEGLTSQLIEENNQIKEQLNILQLSNDKQKLESNQERDQLLRSINLKDEEIKKISYNISEVTEKLNTMQAENENLNDQLVSHQSKSESYKTENEKLLETTKDLLKAKDSFTRELNNLRKQRDSAISSWTEKYENLTKVKNKEIERLKHELTEKDSLLNKSMKPKIGILGNGQLSRAKFNVSEIFEDKKEGSVDEVNLSLPPSTSDKKAKKILAPSNKVENYKNKISSMSKDKKLKRKASQHKTKNKMPKINNTKV